MQDLRPTSPAELALLDAMNSEGTCFVGDGVPDGVATGHPERLVRAEFLALQLRGSGRANNPLRLVGASIVGSLDLRDMLVRECVLESCRLDGVEALGVSLSNPISFTRSQIQSATFAQAVFRGSADFTHAQFSGYFTFEDAVFQGPVDFTEAQIEQLARFTRASFRAPASFDNLNCGRGIFTECQFGSQASFREADFHSGVKFDGAVLPRADFGGLTTTGVADFHRATLGDGSSLARLHASELVMTTAKFEGKVVFDHLKAESADLEGAEFQGETSFARCGFRQGVSFLRVGFNSGASFEGADLGGALLNFAQFAGATYFEDVQMTHGTFADCQFSGYTSFLNAVFTGGADFARANFHQELVLAHATVLGTADFAEAEFSARANFKDFVADTLLFNNVEFRDPDVGPWQARHLSLLGAVLHARTRTQVSAETCVLDGMEAREGVHLDVWGATISAAAADLAGRSIVAGAPRHEPVYAAGSPDEARRYRERWNDSLASARPMPSLTSVRRANVSELVLSDLDLRHCRFAGAHGLDKLRIDATCQFKDALPRLGITPAWVYTRRRLIDEEVAWRRARVRRFRKRPLKGHQPEKPLDALAIASTYRDLRKGLEDLKDEPGAGDYYYGECEMRRLALRRTTGGPDSATLQRDRLSGRLLLLAYWAVSGYGLRAWRAVVALVAVLLVCASLFTLPYFAVPTPAEPRLTKIHPRTGSVTYSPARLAESDIDFSTGLVFTVRESLALFRATGPQPVQPTTPGIFLVLAVRLISPLLLGLAALALRGRTKR